MNLDSQTIEIPCPQCGHKTKETVGRLKRDPTITCGGCRKPIKIEAAELRDALAGVQRQLDSLAKTLKGLGKR